MINNSLVANSMGMMSESTLPLIFGIHLDVFLMLVSGVFYIICALFVYRSYKKSPSELVGALIAFLVYQSINMFFMGLELVTMNMLYSNIASLSVFIGSAYMLKFPFSSFSKGTRQSLFLLSLVVVLGVFYWFMQTEERQMDLMSFTLWYDMVVNGIVVGGFMLVIALKTVEKWLKIKAYGSSAGVVSCCVVAGGAMISGQMLLSAVVGFLAPVIILASLFIAKKTQA
jgi:hypothetical protein